MPARRSVAMKVLAGMAAIMALGVLVGVSGLRAGVEAGRATESIADQSLVELGRLREATDTADKSRQAMISYVVATSDTLRLGTASELEHHDRVIAEYIDDANAGSPAQQEAITALETAWSRFVSERDAAIALVDEGDLEAGRNRAVVEADDAFRSVQLALANIDDLESAEARAVRERSHDRYLAGRARVLTALGLAAILGIAIAFLLARRISSALRSVTSAAEGLARGDLSRRAEIKSNDEIATMATAFNQMASELEAMVEHDRDVKEALEGAVTEYSEFASRVASGDLTARVDTNGSQELTALTSDLNGMVSGLGDLSSQVSDSAQALTQSAAEILQTVSEQSATVTQQSAAINQTSVTVDELRASAEQAAVRAHEVARQAQTSVQVSSEGSAAVTDLVARMDDIRVRVETIAQNILTLSEQTQQISELTQMVDDIAEQSNLLALNATIEAARAGEQGRGFQVVAAEVRNLAEQSKGGTAQVRTILTDIQRATNAAVMATEQGIKVVEEGRTHTSRAGSAISDLAQTIRETAQAAQQISASAQQQSLAIDQISESMTDINQAASQFVSGVEESKSAARSLSSLATELRGLTDRYRVVHAQDTESVTETSQGARS
jgi:methyl-accepting chemotaxis protein